MPLWAKKRLKIGVPIEAPLLISVGELNENKNNRVIIEAMKDIPEVHYIPCGDGPLREKLEALAEPIKDRVHFLGFRTDIKELLVSADVFVMPSIREGLSRSLMEAMASGLPCVVSDIRGNRDLVSDKHIGTLSENTVDAYAMNISKYIERNNYFKRNNTAVREEICKIDVNLISYLIASIYSDMMKGIM